MRRRAVLLMMLVVAVSAPPARAAMVTNAADNGRTGWYPQQSALTPQLVASSSFGQMFKTTLAVGDQVDAQPLVVGDTVIVVTEQNNAYGLDATTGAVTWHRGSSDLGTPVMTADSTRDPTIPGDPGCDVPRRTTGITSTPVADTSTNTAWFMVKHYVGAGTDTIAYTLHAVDVDTGAERSGFPRDVPDGMLADNQTRYAGAPDFTARWELQRPGLLLLGGVVYSAYAGHCDHGHYEGWVIGQDAATGGVTSSWVDVPYTPGGGIWQSGGGLVSDGPNRILLTTGNNQSPAGDQPITVGPAGLGSSVVRIAIGADRKLSTADFFTPYDSALLDENDVDFGSGGPVALPDAYFGTAQYPHLMVAMGKQGIAYLLNRDHLGGYRAGAGGGDDVLQAAGTIGGVWSRPSVWPGDGGWLWVNTASGSGGECCGGSGRLEALGYGVTAQGKPAFTIGEGESADAFSLDSGAPIITSDGAQNGSGIVWIVRAPFDGFGGELRAYRAVPDPITHTPVEIASWPIGRSAKFQPPGVGAGRIFVAARGCLHAYEPAQCTTDTPAALLSFGSPTIQPLTGAGLDFPDTEVGHASTLTATLQATRDVTLTGIATDSDQFSIGAPSSALGTVLHVNDTVTVPVTFQPSAVNTTTATLQVMTSGGEVDLGLSGQAITPVALLRSVAPISFGGVVTGGSRSLPVRLADDGAADLHVTGLSLEHGDRGFGVGATAPFTIEAGKSVIVDLTFHPTASGAVQDTMHVASDGGAIAVVLSGTAAAPGRIEVTPLTLDFGRVVVRQSTTRTFTVANRGGSPSSLTRSQAPGGGIFTALSTLSEATTLAPGEMRTETVRFAPTALGVATNGWSVNADDGLGERNVAFTGTGVEAMDVAPLSLPPTVVGAAVTGTATFTANAALTVTSLDLPDGEFVLGLPAPSLPASLAAGGTLTVPVRFAPLQPGPASQSLTAETSLGLVTTSVASTALTPVFTPTAPPWVASTSPVDLADRTAPTLRLGHLTGRTLPMTLGEAGRARIVITRSAPGRRVGLRCRAAARSNRHDARCTRTVTVKTLAKRLARGTAKVTLPKLQPGRYRLTVTASDAANNSSAARRVTYVVRAARRP